MNAEHCQLSVLRTRCSVAAWPGMTDKVEERRMTRNPELFCDG